MIVAGTAFPGVGAGRDTPISELSQITASGSGEAYIAPDRAVIQMGVEVQDTSTSMAASANTAPVISVMDTLAVAGSHAE